MKQTLKYIYERLLDMLRIAEGKYAITIALASGVIVFCSSFVSVQNLATRVLAGGTIVFSLVSIIYGFVALFARRIKVHTKKSPTDTDNLMFYKNISKFSAEDYIEQIKKAYKFPASYKPDGFDLDLAKTIIAQARVITLKFWYFNVSLFFLILAVLLAVVMILIIGGVLYV